MNIMLNPFLQLYPLQLYPLQLYPLQLYPLQLYPLQSSSTLSSSTLSSSTLPSSTLSSSTLAISGELTGLSLKASWDTQSLSVLQDIAGTLLYSSGRENSFSGAPSITMGSLMVPVQLYYMKCIIGKWIFNL